ncbi:unnamed protein product [Moneuplotes crassus]|uniref:RING-type domain-containing protein n=1 Tax=Euplotes crassus TaxID=5936 RepID=A0AAD1XMB8_EUPCR|nr:unnamed protein product [Moneuplotes crassus]
MKNNSGEEQTCSVCEETLEGDIPGIVCSQGHHICPDCSGLFVQNMLNKPETQIPAQCCFCKTEIDTQQVERQLSSEQKITYEKYYALNRLDPKLHKAVHCQYCEYFEIWRIDNNSIFFYCRNKECRKGTCLVCDKDLKVSESAIVTKSRTGKLEREVMSHSECSKYLQINQDWLRALIEGEQRVCPKCKSGGLKNDACNKMTCDKCNILWCYVCGQDEEHADKQDPNGNFYQHFIGWENNSKRCPKMLKFLAANDQRWDKDDEEANRDFFYKICLYKSLRGFFKKYTQEQFDALCEVSPIVQHHGYDLQEAMTMDLEIIKR